MTVLVVGATGNVGRNVVDLLLRAGVEVRATSRDPRKVNLPAEVDLRKADLTEPDTFADALAGVDKVFLYAQPSGIEGTVAVAKAAGVKHAVLLSSAAAADPDPNNWIARWHRVSEDAIERSGLSWTFVRPGPFATNSLQWVQSIKDGKPVRLTYARSYLSSSHELDMAEVSTCALLQDGHEGAKYHITGGDSLTQIEQIGLIGQAIGREIAFEDLTGDEARAQLLQLFGPAATPEIVETRIRYYEQSLEGPAEPDRAVEKIIGKPARTFAEWAVDHKADFMN
jgi:uncharacterized protein YbjT (DUF2867 family)